jgi:transcriptional regulator with XRE-family HTH domain
MNQKRKNEDLINLGVILRILRQRKGYKSAEHFSYDNDLNRTAYWRWENGENMTMKSFLRLCRIHKITPKELFELLQNKFTSQPKEINIAYEKEEKYSKQS